jgi:glycosyltransferase involved in cell wall biosynthesis
MMISVVIPSYNSGKYLARSLDSIFSQDYSDFEVVVIDGNSTDNSLEILRNYQSKYKNMRVYVSDTENSAVDHINCGIMEAKGEIVSWLCADDTYEPGCLKTVAERFNDPLVRWIYGKVKIINDDDVEVRKIVTLTKELFQPRYNYNALCCVSFIAEPSVFMRKNFYLLIGAYDGSKRVRLISDYDYWLRAGKRSRPVYISQHLANWRAHSGSLSTSNCKEQLDQIYQTQRRYSAFWFIPVQWIVYQLSTILYTGMNKINNHKEGKW